MIAIGGVALATVLGGAPAAGVPSANDLPLVEVRSPKEGRRLAVILTGDGGWAGSDKALAKAFSDAGVSVVGLSSPKYFWKRRTPDETAAAVTRIIEHYRAVWGRPETLLVGYSRGADIVPFVASRLSPSAQEGLALVAMLGPGTFAEFEFHAVDLIRSFHRRAAMSTEMAVRAIGGASPLLCIQGADGKDSVCPRLVDLPWVERVVLPGGHHFDGNFGAIARVILEAARQQPGRDGQRTGGAEHGT